MRLNILKNTKNIFGVYAREFSVSQANLKQRNVAVVIKFKKKKSKPN